MLTAAGSGRSLLPEDVTGNTQGIAALLEGMEIEEAIRRLEGIDCKGKGTSCPDQLARALRQLSE